MTALPTRKLEAFRYTDLRSLSAISFAPATPFTGAVTLPDLGMPRLVFLNGAFSPEQSSSFPYVQPFATFAEGSNLPLPLINAEHAVDGITISVPAGVDAGAVMLVSYAAGAQPFAFHPRHRITLGAGAKLTIIEINRGEGVYWHNPVTDIVVAEEATLSHFRLQDESTEAFHLATIRAEVAANGAYEAFTAVKGARLSRAEFHTTLTGAQAHTHLNAAQLLRGNQHGDFTSVVKHRAPNCTSRQTIKSVLDDSARGVFQGRIEVDQIAQKTDGYQMNQALLLAATAEMDIKPELQIFADDVKCSHGATIGALDPEQIFYLRSRGIAEVEARSILIRAFLTEALEPVTHEGALEMFEAEINNWWAA